MTKEIRVSKSVIGSEEKEAVLNVLQHEYLGMGKDVKVFEDILKDYFNRDVVCVNTGTAALHLALQAIGIKNGDEVLVQSLTYLATFQAISATGATPVPCEIREDTFTIDLNDAEQKLTERTKVILPVHYAGCSGNLDAIYKFAEKNKLRVVEDAAHAFGTVYNDKLIGSFGDIACFSFDGIKNITSGEGGAIVSKDKTIIQKISDARLLGVIKDSEKRYLGERSWEYDVEEQGWRYHMSNIMAAIGIEQFKKFPLFKKQRQRLAKLYQKFLKDVDGIELLKHDYDLVVPHIFVLRVKKINRDLVRERLKNLGIHTGIHYKPNHLLKYFDSGKKFLLPITEKIYNEIITLPLHPDLTFDDVEYISHELKKFF